MPILRNMERQLRQTKNANDEHVVLVMDRLRGALDPVFTDSSRASAEIAASVAINGYEATADRLCANPDHFGALKERAHEHLPSVMAVFQTYDRAVREYWQSNDELEHFLEERNRDRELDLDR